MDDRKVIYYHDELTEEFSTTEITPRTIDENYNYDGHKVTRALARVFWYRIIALPTAWCFMKSRYHHKIVNKDKLKKARKTGCFIYGNHTNDIGDALTPALTSFPKAAFVIVHPNNVSMPYLGRITPYLGAIPLPDNMAATKNFTESIKKKAEHGKYIMIYPEAHIWPFYTKIRPFVDTSFRYPVQYDKPVYTITNTYQKYKKSKYPQIVTYVDGPFYPDKNLRGKEQRKQLRDLAYNTMVMRSKNNNVEMIKYIKAETPTENKLQDVKTEQTK